MDRSKPAGMRGFSLPEVLVALLLLSLSTGALLRYQQVIARGFSQQWQQQQVWSALWQRLQGGAVEGSPIELQRRPGPAGCELRQAVARLPRGDYALNWLICGKEVQ